MPQKTNNHNLNITLIETNFENNSLTYSTREETYRKRSEEVTLALQKILPHNPDIIVLPENTSYISTYRGRLSNLKEIISSSMLLIDGEESVDKNIHTDNTLFYTPSDNQIVKREKVFFSPFGEYFPYIFLKPFSYLVDQQFLDNLISENTYRVGDNNPVYHFRNLSIGTLLCSEIFSYRVLNELQKQHPDIVFYQSYVSLFHNSILFRMNMISFTKIAAAQMRTPIFQASNGSVSLIVDARGNLVEEHPNMFQVLHYKMYSRKIELITQ